MYFVSRYDPALGPAAMNLMTFSASGNGVIQLGRLVI